MDVHVLAEKKSPAYNTDTLALHSKKSITNHADLMSRPLVLGYHEQIIIEQSKIAEHEKL